MNSNYSSIGWATGGGAAIKDFIVIFLPFLTSFFIFTRFRLLHFLSFIFHFIFSLFSSASSCSYPSFYCCFYLVFFFFLGFLFRLIILRISAGNPAMLTHVYCSALKEVWHSDLSNLYYSIFQVILLQLIMN